MQTSTTISDEGRAVIGLRGRFDFSAHRDFRAAIDAAVDNPQVKEVQVDLGQVDYLDSSALGMLLILRDKIQTVGKKMGLVNCRGTVRQVLDIANFGKLFAID
jgi:anti-anti-sigma factor